MNLDCDTWADITMPLRPGKIGCLLYGGYGGGIMVDGDPVVLQVIDEANMLVKLTFRYEKPEDIGPWVFDGRVSR